MRIQPKTTQEAMKIVYSVLNQGDSRYNDPESELILSRFIINGAVSLEEIEIPNTDEPNDDKLITIKGVQKIDKYLAKILLKQEGFKDSEIFFEREFLGSRPDVLAESKNKIIAIECCSCRVNKVIDYLSEAEEVWILTLGEPPWEKIHYLKGKMQWFIFKKGDNWNHVLEFKKSQIEQIKKVKSPLDSLMEKETGN